MRNGRNCHLWAVKCYEVDQRAPYRPHRGCVGWQARPGLSLNRLPGMQPVEITCTGPSMVKTKSVKIGQLNHESFLKTLDLTTDQNASGLVRAPLTLDFYRDLTTLLGIPENQLFDVLDISVGTRRRWRSTNRLTEQHSSTCGRLHMSYFWYGITL